MKLPFPRMPSLVTPVKNQKKETTETDSSEEDAVAEVSDEEQVPHEEPVQIEEDSKESK